MRKLWLLFTIFVASCVNTNRKEPFFQTETRESLAMPVLDLKKEYPKKTIALQDIADVEYITLETHDKGLVAGHYTTITDSFIITYNSSWDVVFFHRDGRFSHSFNRIGGSGEEYSPPIGLNLCVNPELREVYINDVKKYRIQVYSYDGKYKRTLRTKGGSFAYGALYPLDSNNLLLEDLDNVGNYNGKPTNPKPYYKISVTDGKMTRLPLTVENRIGNTFRLPPDKETGQGMCVGVNISPVAKINGELLITPFVSDTLYSYRDGHMVPIAKKQNWMKENGACWLVTLNGISDKYFLWWAIEKDLKKIGWYDRTYLQDRYTGACSQIKLVDGNITDNSMPGKYEPNANRYCPPDNCIMHYYSAYQLVELYKKGKLQGKLKEIASKLSEEDNPVIMLAKFK